jgi:hypothetical protein
MQLRWLVDRPVKPGDDSHHEAELPRARGSQRRGETFEFFQIIDICLVLSVP